MQIKLNFKIFILALFFLFNLGYETYIYLMIFAMLHELGHMLMGIFLGVKPKSLKIMPIGFSVSFMLDSENYNEESKEFKTDNFAFFKSNILSIKKLMIALAGPAVNLICIIFFKNTTIVYTNILILIFNVLPIYPLDGGRILKNLMELILGRKKALDVTYVVSNLFMWITIIATGYIVYWSKNIAYLFIVLYVLIITIQENKKYKLRKKIYKILENYIAIN